MKTKIKQLISNFKYNFRFLKVLNSPFIGLKLKWYFGEIQHGTPYFLPRKWVKCDREDAVEAWNKLSDDTRNHTLLKNDRNKERWLNDYTKNHTKAVPIKYFGWDFTTLGWKTKWDDYRFEWNPSLSIVIFGKQLFISVIPNNKVEDVMITDTYWEAWLNYEYRTDKTKSKVERLKELKEIHSCTWSSGSGDDKILTDYYNLILKEKYKK